MKYGVFIGRFQPVHKIHELIIKQALKKYDRLIILIGSSNSTISLRNPFSDSCRTQMLQLTVEWADVGDRIYIQTLSDSSYNFNQWINNVQKIVYDYINMKRDLNAEIFLLGMYKDEGSYWLNYFPQWKLDDLTGKQYVNINGTDIRNSFFTKNDTIWMSDVPSSIVDRLQIWKKDNKDLWEKLSKEKNFIDNYKRQWENAPYPPVFVTVDSLVICKGHIVIIERGRNPGKGLFALPGGFINQNETLKDAAIRELKEETKIDVAKPVLENSLKQIKVFDAIHRDDRGRFITHTHVFDLKLKDFPSIKAGDDANKVMWMPFSLIEENRSQFYADHYQIISNILMGY